MKKIHANINQKDRVISAVHGKQQKFYFQPHDDKKNWVDLFADERISFSGSLFVFFRDNGRYCCNSNGDYGYSLTVKELYSVDKKLYRNFKLDKLLNRLPGAIQKACGNTVSQKPKPISDKRRTHTRIDFERVA